MGPRGEHGPPGQNGEKVSEIIMMLSARNHTKQARNVKCIKQTLILYFCIRLILIQCCSCIA